MHTGAGASGRVDVCEARRRDRHPSIRRVVGARADDARRAVYPCGLECCRGRAVAPQYERTGVSCLVGGGGLRIDLETRHLIAIGEESARAPEARGAKPADNCVVVASSRTKIVDAVGEDCPEHLERDEQRDERGAVLRHDVLPPCVLVIVREAAREQRQRVLEISPASGRAEPRREDERRYGDGAQHDPGAKMSGRPSPATEALGGLAGLFAMVHREDRVFLRFRHHTACLRALQPLRHTTESGGGADRWQEALSLRS